MKRKHTIIAFAAVASIGIVALISYLQYRRILQSRADTMAQVYMTLLQLDYLYGSIMHEYQKTGNLPDQLPDLLNDPNNNENWQAVQMLFGFEDYDKDFWGFPFVVAQNNDPNEPFVVYSSGPDGIPGTRDDITRDIAFDKEDLYKALFE